MESNNTSNHQNQSIEPPRLIPSFVSGFNMVANNIYLIVFPIVLDLFLWFGPHLRIKNLFLPFILDTLQTVRESGSTQSQELLVGIEEIWRLFLEHYNLVSSASTFPLGIPSLMAAQSPIETPLGSSQMIEISSLPLVLIGWLFFSLAGLTLGSLYFALLAYCYPKGSGEPVRARFKPRVLAWMVLQMIILVLFLTILLTIILFPTLIISSILVLLSPFLSWIVLLGMSFLGIWVLIPLCFTPHGIFMFHQNALNAALNSARMVRYFLPGTGLFLLISIILYQGMGVLWRTPTETSWMSMVGIAGHAFTSTGVIASSFVYYLSCFNWVQAMRRAAAVSPTSGT